MGFSKNVGWKAVPVADAGEIQNKAAVYVKVKLEQVALPTTTLALQRSPKPCTNELTMSLVKRNPLHLTPRRHDRLANATPPPSFTASSPQAAAAKKEVVPFHLISWTSHLTREAVKDAGAG